MDEYVVDLAAHRAVKSKDRNSSKSIRSLMKLAGNHSSAKEINEGYVSAKAAVASADLLREMRLHSGLTQSALASALNIKQSRVAYLESGKSVQGPTIGTLYKVASVCGLAVTLGFEELENDGDSSKKRTRSKQDKVHTGNNKGMNVVSQHAQLEHNLRKKG